MELIIALDVFCFVLCTTTAALYASQKKLVLTIIYLLSALCWVATGAMNYEILNLRGY